MFELDSVNVKIVEHCNYKCKACNTFSPIADSMEYNLMTYEKDIVRLSELFKKVHSFKILGGEPLLSSNITDYIKIARNNLGNSNISIITNGSLLPHMKKDFYDVVKANNVSFNISYYNSALSKHVDKGIELLQSKEIPHKVVPIHYFAVWHKDNASEDNPQKTYDYCRGRVDSTNLYNGRLYGCSVPFGLIHYDKKYQTNRAMISDGIDIHQKDIKAQDILEHLSKAMQSCKDCTMIHSFINWEEGYSEQSNWDVDDNDLVLKDFTWRDYLEKMDKLSYQIINYDFEVGKIQNHTISENEFASLNNSKLYIWVQDVKSCSFYDEVLKNSIKNKGVHVDGIISNAISTEKELSGFDIIEINEIKESGNIIVLSSDYKNHFTATRKIQKMMNLK